MKYAHLKCPKCGESLRVDKSRMGKRSKDTGKDFERDIAKRLTTITGKRWRRTICSGGQYESYDVKCLDGGYPPVECKNRADITLEKVWRNPDILRGIVDESSVVVFHSGNLNLCVVPCSLKEGLAFDRAATVADLEVDGIPCWLFSLDHFMVLGDIDETTA